MTSHSPSVPEISGAAARPDGVRKPDLFEYNGRLYPVGMIWRYLLILAHQRPALAVPALRSGPPSAAALERVLTQLETARQLPRAAIFAQLGAALARRPAAAHALLAAQIRELCECRRLRPLLRREADEIVDLILRFLRRWLPGIWAQALACSLKRVDCPPAALIEAGVKDDLWYQAHVEKLRAERAANTPGAVPANSSTSAIEPSGLFHNAPANHTATSLQDLGLDDPLFQGVLGCPALNDLREDQTGASAPLDPNRGPGNAGAGALFRQAQGPGNLGATDTAADRHQRLMAAAERHAQEANAVRRKQAKLTREVSVDDLIVIIASQNGRFPLPALLRAEILQYLTYLRADRPQEVDLTNKFTVCAYRNAASGSYVSTSDPT